MTFHLKYVAFGLSAACSCGIKLYSIFISSWAYEELGMIQMRLIFHCALIKDKYILQCPAGHPWGLVMLRAGFFLSLSQDEHMFQACREKGPPS